MVGTDVHLLDDTEAGLLAEAHGGNAVDQLESRGVEVDILDGPALVAQGQLALPHAVAPFGMAVPDAGGEAADERWITVDPDMLAVVADKVDGASGDLPRSGHEPEGVGPTGEPSQPGL